MSGCCFWAVILTPQRHVAALLERSWCTDVIARLIPSIPNPSWPAVREDELMDKGRCSMACTFAFCVRMLWALVPSSYCITLGAAAVPRIREIELNDFQDVMELKDVRG